MDFKEFLWNIAAIFVIIISLIFFVIIVKLLNII